MSTQFPVTIRIFHKKKRNQNDGIIIFVKKSEVNLHEFSFDKCNILRLAVNTILYYCVYSWSPSTDVIDFISKLMFILDNKNSFN